ncbi:MAG: hypothetical protein NUW37_10790 [Planctomycetes bacterium]|nr:hypothetical protein [Planctomycetota bacterium]
MNKIPRNSFYLSIYLISVLGFARDAKAQSEADVFGKWLLIQEFANIRCGHPGHAELLARMTSDFIDVEQSGTNLLASYIDPEEFTANISGSVIGNGVSFTIEGFATTPGIGPATTSYAGTYDLKSRTITGTMSGSGGPGGVLGNPELIDFCNWSGAFTVVIMDEIPDEGTAAYELIEGIVQLQTLTISSIIRYSEIVRDMEEQVALVFSNEEIRFIERTHVDEANDLHHEVATEANDINRTTIQQTFALDRRFRLTLNTLWRNFRTAHAATIKNNNNLGRSTVSSIKNLVKSGGRLVRLHAADAEAHNGVEIEVGYSNLVESDKTSLITFVFNAQGSEECPTDNLKWVQFARISEEFRLIKCVFDHRGDFIGTDAITGQNSDEIFQVFAEQVNASRESRSMPKLFPSPMALNQWIVDANPERVNESDPTFSGQNTRTVRDGNNIVQKLRLYDAPRIGSSDWQAAIDKIALTNPLAEEANGVVVKFEFRSILLCRSNVLGYYEWFIEQKSCRDESDPTGLREFVAFTGPTTHHDAPRWFDGKPPLFDELLVVSDEEVEIRSGAAAVPKN